MLDTVTRAKLPALRAAAREATTRGWSVTKPSPEIVLALLDALDEAERERGEIVIALLDELDEAERGEAQHVTTLTYAAAVGEALRGYAEAHHRELHIGRHHEWELRVSDSVRDAALAALAQAGMWSP